MLPHLQKHHIISLITAVFMLLGSVQIALGQELKVATFNCEFLVKRKVHVKYGLPMDLGNATKEERTLWLNQTHREKKFLEATRKIAAHIKAIGADIIGLTEVGNKEEVQMLVQALSDIGVRYNHWAVCKSADKGTGQHVAILSRYELHDIEPSFENRGLYFTESDKDETEETGISKGMKASVRIDGKEITLFLVHLKSEVGGYESDKQRLKQAEIIRNITIPYLQNGKHIMVMGDFNSEKRHEVLLTLRGFKDIFPELIQTGDTPYFKDFTSRWTYQYKGSKEQIDHILISIPLTKLCYANTPKRYGIETQVIRTEDPLISDHNALLVKLLFKN